MLYHSTWDSPTTPSLTHSLCRFRSHKPLPIPVKFLEKSLAMDLFPHSQGVSHYLTICGASLKTLKGVRVLGTTVAHFFSCFVLFARHTHARTHTTDTRGSPSIVKPNFAKIASDEDAKKGVTHGSFE